MVDVILNILLLLNYVEFKWFLKKDGFLLKVVLEVNYLCELCEFIYVDEKSSYLNELVILWLVEKLSVEYVEWVIYKVLIVKELFVDFFEMMLFGWYIEVDKKSELLGNLLEELIVDL